MKDWDFAGEDPQWYLTHSLAQRAATPHPEGEVETDLPTGEARLKLWLERLPFLKEPGALEEHARRLDMDSSTLVTMFGETPESVRRRFSEPPSYVAFVREALQRADETESEAYRDWGLAEGCVPLVDLAVADLTSRIVALDPTGTPVDVNSLAECLASPPTAQVNQIVGRTLALEMNVARLQGELRSDSAHERYHEFLARTRRPDRLAALLAEYPVLAQEVVRTLRNWADTRYEFARRLVDDYPELASVTGQGADLGDVEHVEFGAGDTHRGGRSVARVQFGNGTRVMYKPRSLSIDRHFQELLSWLNARGLEPALATMWVVDRDEYGWTEFVRETGCDSADGLDRFFARHGSLLAILHALAATDMHFENVIAAGEHPVIVDLEALFHSWKRELGDSFEIPRAASELMHSSVLGVGLLPAPAFWVDVDTDEAGWSDHSGVSDAGDQLTSNKVPVWDRAQTDEMRIVRRRISQSSGQNVPTLGGRAASVADHREAVVDGYRRTYELLRTHRDDLLAADGPLEAFADDEVRLLARRTQVYYTALSESWHPDMQRDALDRDGFLDAMWRDHEDLPCREVLIAAEIEQLKQGDIPVFGTTPASRDLYSDGRLLAESVLDQSGLENARQRIRDLSPAGLEQQSWFVEASLTAHVMGHADDQHESASAPVPSPLRTATSEELRAEAAAIGDRLLRTAVWDGPDRICWLGVNLVGEEVWQVSPTRMDLFNGLSGIALFLGYLGHTTGNHEYRAAAEAAASMVAGQIERLESAAEGYAALSGLGAFGDLGGPLYALSHLGSLWGRADLLDAASSIVPHLAERLPHDTAFDVINGSAGGILAMLALHAARPTPEALDTAERMAEHIVGHADHSGTGIRWVGSANPGAALAGMSHGASGVAVALARLDRVLAGNRYDDVVRGALEFERSLFDEEHGNWADLRATTPDGTFMTAWCHGAGGIGLARAELLRHGWEAPGTRQDLHHALDRIEHTGIADDPVGGVSNHSLCHGALGDIETLLTGALAMGDADEKDVLERARACAANVLAHRDAAEWRCGVPMGVETPGLMPGLAGIGYGLLRLADPHAVPSVLLLEGPGRGS